MASTLEIETQSLGELGHLEERGFGASIEADFIVGSQVRLHRATHACPQAYFGMILARISGGFWILGGVRLRPVVAHGNEAAELVAEIGHGDPARGPGLAPGRLSGL